jgi:putative spermidine/putrescine transport system ATP-binding protein
MHEGRFAQVGAPIDVHNNPRSRIVASFLGDLNVLEPAAIQQIFGVNSTQAWAIHPGSLTISTEGPDRETLSLAATITDHRVLGPVVRYGLETSGHRLTMDRLNLPGHMPLGHGLDIKIALAKTAVRPLGG